ncbi:MAG TPA: hypothetical protein VEU33_05090 [Archangium sp.]|nr:hypothetical protein [Archangium sp.]
MSEVSHFFAALVANPSLFRKSLERARILAILDSAGAGDGPPMPQGLPIPALNKRWLSFASPSDNREALWKLTERLVEVFDDGGNWSLSLFIDREKLTLSIKDLEPTREGIGTSARQQEWLRHFLGCSPGALLATLSAGGMLPFCKAVGIPFLELADQDMVPWEHLSRQFPDRYVLDFQDLSG